MGAERLAAASSMHSACEKKKKFFFVQISVFVRGQKMGSELIHLLLDKTMVRPEPRFVETVKRTRRTDQRNAKQFSSTASDATPPAVL